MKFLHCSDLHLGRRPAGGQGEFSQKRYRDFFTAFERIIEIAIKEEAAAMLITGDLFDRRELSPQVLEDTEKLLKKIAEANIPVLITEGNHDNITRGREEDSWLVYLEGQKLLKRLSCNNNDGEYVFDSHTIDDVEFFGAGYPGAFVDETLTALAGQLNSTGAEKRIVLVHTAVCPENFLPGTVEPKTIDLLKGKAAYIAGGHFHKYITYPKTDPIFFIPGSPEYWDLGEKGQRGCILFDTDTGIHTFHSSSPRNKIELEIIVDTADRELFRAAFREKLHSAAINKGEDILIITIKLKKKLYIDSSWCYDEAEEAGALKTEIRINSPRYKGGNIDQTRPVFEIEEEIISEWDGFGAYKKDVTAALQQLKIHQMENNEELFIETLDAMMEHIVQEENADDTQ